MGVLLLAGMLPLAASAPHKNILQPAVRLDAENCEAVNPDAKGPECASSLKKAALVKGDHNLTLAEFAHGHPPFTLVLANANFDPTAWKNALNEQEYSFHVSTANAVMKHLVGKDEKCSVLDIGGNIGYVAMMWASLGCEVQTWEANPYSAKLIRKSIAANKENGIGARVEVMNNAIAQKEGDIKFAVHGTGSIYDHVAEPGEKMGHLAGKEWSLVTVKGMPLPSREGKPLTYVKIDCEGCEPVAAQGLSETLKDSKVRPKIVQTEWIPDRMVKPGPKAFVRLFTDAGYEAVLPNGDVVKEAQLLKEGFGDLFFIHKDFLKKFECLSKDGADYHGHLSSCPEREGKLNVVLSHFP